MDEKTQLALIRDDYVGKIKKMFETLPEDRIGLYNGKYRSLYPNEYTVQGYVSQYVLMNFDGRVYDVLMNENGMLYVVFSNYMEDWIFRLEYLNVMDIVGIYNNLQKSYAEK